MNAQDNSFPLHSNIRKLSTGLACMHWSVGTGSVGHSPAADLVVGEFGQCWRVLVTAGSGALLFISSLDFAAFLVYAPKLSSAAMLRYCRWCQAHLYISIYTTYNIWKLKSTQDNYLLFYRVTGDIKCRACAYGGLRSFCDLLRLSPLRYLTHFGPLWLAKF